MTENVRLTINRNPEAPPGEGNRFSKAKAASEDTAAQVRARRKQIHDQASHEIAGGQGGPELPEQEPPPQREDLESIEIPLRDGRIIEYGPPTGVSLMDRIARLYAGRDPGITEYRLTRLLMGVRAIDGKPVPSIASEIDRTKLANQLGDEAIDLIMYFDRLHWPPITPAELPVVKKNLRRA